MLLRARDKDRRSSLEFFKQTTRRKKCQGTMLYIFGPSLVYSPPPPSVAAAGGDGEGEAEYKKGDTILPVLFAI